MINQKYQSETDAHHRFFDDMLIKYIASIAIHNQSIPSRSEMVICSG
jgi:hypothetical protein